MAKLRIGASYWLDRFVGRAPRHPALKGERHIDVAVVGGGITGCLAAHAFVSAGFSVLILEANRIGYGSTAASTALLMREPDLDFRDLASRYGRQRTREIWRQSAKSVSGLIALIRSLRIPADLEEVGSVYWTARAGVAKDLESEYRRRRSAGIGARWLSPSALKQQIGVEGAGGILTRGNAQVDPYRACLGIADRVRRQGGRIYESTSVRRMNGTSRGVTLDVDDGRVNAEWAVIATGFATPEFKPLAGRFRMSNTYVVATSPVEHRLRRQLGSGMMWWDAETPYHYARWTPDRRLLFGGRDLPRVSSRTRPTVLSQQIARLTSDLEHFHPALEQTPIDYAWEGLFATTRDGLPYIGTHRRYPRQLFALGYGGNGMTFGFLAAEALVRVVRSTPTEVDRFFGFNRFS